MAAAWGSTNCCHDSLTDGSEHQNGGNSKRQRVTARVETEHVTWAATNST